MPRARSALNREKYPWFSLTLLTSFTYLIMFALCYFASGTTYFLFTDVPADRSREISAYYYGIIFCVVPFLVISLFRTSLPVRPLHAFVFHTLAVAWITEKGFIVFMATLLASGYPEAWYGSVYPEGGFHVLCEEFSFYCGSYVKQYLSAGTLLSCISLYSGALLCGRLTSSKEFHTKRD